jgi:hypothetical protein
MSAKNKLQEFFQKRKEALPVYSTARDPLSEAHNPKWKSTVTVHGGQRFIGEQKTKKSDAECSAAQEAITVLQLNNPVEKKISLVDFDNMDCLKTPEDVFRTCMDSKTIVLIDIENIPQAIDLTCSIPTDAAIVGLVGHCHSKVEAHFPFYKYVVRNAMKDAVDHAITFMAGFIAGGINDNLVFTDHKDFPEERPKFLILSRDHYAEITCWCIKQQGFEAVHLTTMTDFVKYLDLQKPKEDTEPLCKCGGGLRKSCDCGCDRCAHQNEPDFDLFD